MANNKVLIFKRLDQLLTVLVQDKTLVEVHVNDDANKSLIGNIYIGRVQNIVKNIEAAFVEIDKGLVCYLPLSDLKHPYFTNRTTPDGNFPSKPLTIGDELLVQVTKDALKTKQPAVSSNLSIPGEYLVLNHGDIGFGISSKIKGEKREELKTYFSSYFKEDREESFGVVIRTNAGDLPIDEWSKIADEFNELKAFYQQMMSIASYRPAFTRLFSKPSTFSLDQIYNYEYEEIITDQKEVYDSLMELQRQNKLMTPVRYYEDTNLSLMNLYGMESRIKEALETRIWLKSGGYLIIEPTEALTVIDVNTGKFDGKSASYEDTMFKINLEAAIEVAHQLRLRNISGIVIVDFINMNSQNHVQDLLSVFKAAVSKDSIQTTVMGMTSLGLVEVTRKKKNKPLRDQIRRV